MTHSDLHPFRAEPHYTNAMRYAAIRALICGPDETLVRAGEIADAMTGGERPTHEQFDAVVDAVVASLLTE